jgi:hypothetical protein
VFSLLVTGKRPHRASNPYAVCTNCDVGCRSKVKGGTAPTGISPKFPFISTCFFHVTDKPGISIDINNSIRYRNENFYSSSNKSITTFRPSFIFLLFIMECKVANIN